MLNGAAPGGMGNSCENPPRRRTRPRLVHPLREADDDNEDKQESSEIMKEHTILFPVCGTLYPYRMSHHSFWLARYLPARLCLVEVLLPTGWFRWLLSHFSREDREWRLRETERLVFRQDDIICQTDTLRVPNLVVGIVEAAWRVKPNYIVLMPELQELLGKSGLRDLKTRIGEMGRCMLVLLKNGPVIRLEPCNTVDSLDVGRVVHVQFGR